MAVNTTTLVNAVQTKVDAITASCDNKDILLAAVAANRAICAEGHKKVTVATVNDLPLSDSGNPSSTVGVGHMIYVESIGVPVVSASNGWYGLDRRQLRKDGPDRQLWVWGDNSAAFGSLGTGNTTKRSSPVTTAGGGTNWCYISTGCISSLAIKTDGTLWAWGQNGVGQLGTGDVTNRSSPVTTIDGGNNWCQVELKYCTSAGIKTNGTLWMWGFGNLSGQLGGVMSNVSSPVTTAGGGDNWCQVSTGCRHSGAVKTDGTLWMWGYNSDGQMGSGAGITTSSPITTAGGGTNWKQISLACLSSMGLKTDGTLWAWGVNTCGQLGTNNLTTYSSPVTVSGGGTNWCQVSANSCHTGAVKTDGTLWMWGAGSGGRLGTGSATTRSSPITTAGGGTTWCQVSTGGVATSGAIKTDGTLWTWGDNTCGQLGTGNVTSTQSPVTTIAGGTNWCRISVGICVVNAITASL